MNTIAVEVRLSPIFRLKLHQRVIKVKLTDQEHTLRSLLVRLAQITEGRIDDLLFEKTGHRTVLTGLMVKIQGIVFSGTALNHQDVQLKNQDVVELMYFISGG